MRNYHRYTDTEVFSKQCCMSHPLQLIKSIYHGLHAVLQVPVLQTPDRKGHCTIDCDVFKLRKIQPGEAWNQLVMNVYFVVIWRVIMLRKKSRNIYNIATCSVGAHANVSLVFCKCTLNVPLARYRNGNSLPRSQFVTMIKDGEGKNRKGCLHCDLSSFA